MMFKKLVPMLAILLSLTQHSDAALQWVAVGNQPNANNVNAAVGVQNTNNNGPDTGEITIGVIPTSDQLNTSDLQVKQVSTYTINLGLDLTGIADGSTANVTVSDLLGGFALDTVFAGSDPATQVVSDGGTMRYTFAGATKDLSTLPVDPGTGLINVLRVVFELPTGLFTDNALGAASAIDLDLLPGMSPDQTQFGEIGTLDPGEAGDPLFHAFPTANLLAPGGGQVKQGHTLQVGVPEPSSFLFLNTIVLGLAGSNWYRRRKSFLG